MKFSFTNLAFFCIFSIININPAVANDAPRCASPLSDSDGDGYGWENNATCTVVIDTTACEDRGDYPWGWNPVSGTSCRLDTSLDTSNNAAVTSSGSPVETGICVDTDGDGYGWDGSATCDPNNAADTGSAPTAETGICVDTDGDGYGWNGSATCDPNSSVATPNSAPEFINLETGEPVVLNLAYWNEADFYKPLTCGWYYFDGASYVRQAGTLYEHNPPRSEPGTGSIDVGGSNGVGTGLRPSPRWSLQDGVYTSPVNPTGSPWIEYQGRGSRFWIDNKSYAHCITINPADGFFPSGTGVPSNDATPVVAPSASIRESEIAADPSWSYCETDNGFIDVELEFGKAWGKQLNSSFRETYSCVRRCGATAFELPNTPGWSYDPDAGAECIVDEDTSSQVSIESAESVPVYDIKSGVTERQLFQDQFGYPLTHGDASWECSRETRQSNSEEFVALGASRSISFDGSSNENWYFDRRQWRQTLTINADSGQEGLFEYNGYAQIEHDTLTVYQTSYDRLSCQRLGNAPDATLPLQISEFEKAESLPLEELVDQPHQCRLLESGRRIQNAGQTDLGWTISSNFQESTDFTFNPTFSTFNDRGERLYDSTQGDIQFIGYTGGTGGFSNFSTGTATFSDSLVAKRIGDNIILQRYSFSRISGGGSDSASYYVCR